MNKVSHWGQPVALLSILLLAVGGANAPTKALATDGEPISVQNGNSFQVAQATVDNLCHRVNVRQGLVVRERPDPSSRAIGGVGYNTQITFVQGYRGITGPDGRIWIEIAAPERGYISSGFSNSQTNVVPCSGTASMMSPTNAAATPTPAMPTAPTAATPAATTANLCRQVSAKAAPQGLIVRADASRLSASRGGVSANAQVMLISGYRAIADKNGERRNWVEISSPIAGYVSTNSLIMCR